MKIKKKYHFYAAHRIVGLTGASKKCESLHGHTYLIEVVLDVSKEWLRGNEVTIPFSSIDEMINPIIQSFDHSIILNKNDSLVELFEYYNSEFYDNEKTDKMKLKLLDSDSSCESLAAYLFKTIHEAVRLLICSLNKVTVQETLTSIVCYDKEDYRRDLQHELNKSE